MRLNNHTLALHYIYKATRMKKSLPMALLIISGAFIGNWHNSLFFTCPVLLIFLASTCLMTQINILTDKELDKETKPQFYQWITNDMTLLKKVIIIECAIIGSGVLTLSFLGFNYLALSLLAFTILGILYSYNFLTPSNPVKYRFKTHWLGHLVVGVFGYFSLWLVGVFTSGQNLGDITYWIPILFLLSLSEYCLFLSDSAIDANEERKYDLKSLGGLLGTRKSAYLSLLLWLLAVTGIFYYAQYLQNSHISYFLLLSPPLIFQGYVLIKMVNLVSQKRSMIFKREQLSDLGFILCRAYFALIFILLNVFNMNII
jgi:4-hydroxybenzoate polyprenyltransferase